MSRKSVARRSSRSPVPSIEDPNLEEQRLDLNNIVQMDPWKDVDKYDKQEVGQIQEILVQFNNMVVEDKKNKRRSVGKSRTPTLSTKTPSGNEALEEGSMKKETIKNDKNQRCKSESSASITIREIIATDETSEIRNIKEKSVDKNENELEKKEEKSFKSKNHVELDVPLDDKKNKRKSVEKRRASTSSTKPTGSNAGLEKKTINTQKIRNDKRQSCISESSVNDTSIDILDNVSINNTSHNQNIKGKPMEKNEYQHEEKKEKLSKARNPVEIDVELNNKNNKRKSVGKSRASTSSTKASGSNAGFEGKTNRNEKMRNDAIQHWISESSVNDATISVPENPATEDTSDNQNTVDKKRKEKREENEDLSSKVINRVGRRSLGKRLNSSSAMQTIASNNSTEGQSTMNKGKFQYWLLTSDGAGSIVDVEANIHSDHKRDNIGIESFEEEKTCTQELEEIRGNNISEAVVEKIVVVDDTLTARMQEISKSVFPAPTNDKGSYVEAIELHSDEPSCDDNSVNNESIISGHLRNQGFQVFSSAKAIEKLESDPENKKNNVLKRDANSAKKSSTVKPRSVSAEPKKTDFLEYTDNKNESKNRLHPGSEKNFALKKEAENSVKQSSIMKARSASAEPYYEKFTVCNNNEFGSKHARKREEKMAKAFEKFGKKFVKYSSRVEQPQNYKTGPNDVTLDSESDSDSSDSSSSSSSDSDESSSSESSSSSSACSCCSGSSSDSSYTSFSGSTSCSSCSCPSCCEDDMYSEYTLESSSSTHPGSDDSTDSSTD